MEYGVVFQMFRELFFVARDAGADGTMNAGVAEFFHLVEGFVGGPSFVGHAVGGYGEAGAVVAETTVNEDFPGGVVVDDFEEVREGCIRGERTMPWDGDVFHPEVGDGGFLGAVVAAAHVDDDGDSHVLEIFETFASGLAPAIEIGSDFAEVSDAGGFLVAGNGVRSLRWRGWRTESEENPKNRKTVRRH